jgi:SAM-dependent methyltransferase
MNPAATSTKSPGSHEVWVDFFDDAYRELYAGLLDPIRTEVEVAAVVKLLALKEGERVLDLCCGDGRHSVPLQRRGMRVTGIDLSGPMIRGARSRARRVLDDKASQPVWLRGDCARLPVKPVFDAAVLLYNSISFGSREMTRALIANARAALGAGGRLLIECMHRDHEARRASVEVDVEETQSAGKQIRIERRFDPVLGEQRALMSFESSPGQRREKHLRYLVYTAGELRQFCLDAGFTNVELFGGYDGRPFSVDTPAVIRAS